MIDEYAVHKILNIYKQNYALHSMYIYKKIDAIKSFKQYWDIDSQDFTDMMLNAIKKATGTQDGVNYENVRYEGYGPNGVAFMVDCLTDNRNRTAPAVRNAFSKSGGNLGTDGSVSYMFERKGTIVISDGYDEDTMMMVSLDAGAEDFEHVEDNYIITTDQENFTKVRDELEKNDVKEFIDCTLTYVPTMEVEITDEEQKEKLYKLIDNLEDLDDVQDVYYNLKEE